MDSYLYKLTSEKWRIGSLLVCMTITMLLAVFDKSVAYQMRWLGLCFICLFGLLLEWKTMLIGTDCVCIRYYPLGFKRIIPNERIFAAEIVSQNHQYYILLTLDGCPQFKNSNTRYPEWYKFKHFRKVVLIQCEQKVAFACKAYFDTNNVRTDVILKQPWGPKNGPIIPT